MVNEQYRVTFRWEIWMRLQADWDLDQVVRREAGKASKSAGGIQWSGRRLTRTKPVARLRGRRTVADLVSEDRE